MPTDPRPATPAALVLVNDDIADDLGRCAAAAGYRVAASTVDDCRREWNAATVVLLDAPSVRALDSNAFPQRANVVVVGADGDPSTAEPELWRAALRLGAADFHTLPTGETALVQALSRLRTSAHDIGTSVAVVGGHGGAGASTLAAAVAITAAERRMSVLLMDTDELGCGMDLLFGLEDTTGLRWPNLTVNLGGVTAEAIHAATPRSSSGVAVLAPRRGDSSPVPVPAALAVLQASRADGELVVVDLPRRCDELMLAVIETVQLTVVVTTATVCGCAATREIVGELREHADRIGLVVRGPAPGGLHAAQIANVVGAELLAAGRPEPRLPARVEYAEFRLGRRSPLRSMADRVLGELAVS